MTSTVPSTYATLFDISLASIAGGVATGDTDGDGLREIIVGRAPTGYPGIAIYERTGNDQYVHRWSSGTLLQGGMYSDGRLLGVTDINNDGKDDILLSIYDGGSPNSARVVMFESSGNDAWSETWTGMTGLGPIYDLTTGDSDNDGRKEIIVAAGRAPAGGRIYVYENTGGTSFSQTAVIGPMLDSGGSPYATLGGLAVADSDGDGRNEIVFTCSNIVNVTPQNDDQLFIYESTGDNSYVKKFSGLAYHVDPTVDPWYYAAVAVADADRDGRNEIIAANSSHDDLWIIESPANDSWVWQPPEYKTALPRGSASVTTSDLDGDGKTEIIAGLEGNPYLIVLESFAADSYVEEWRAGWPAMNNGVYWCTVDQTNDSGYPTVIAGTTEYVRGFGYQPPIDLAVSGVGLTFDPLLPSEEQDVLVTAEIWNLGTVAAQNVRVRFYQGDPTQGGVPVDQQIIPLINGGEGKTASASWVQGTEGAYELYVVVDPENEVKETDENNNSAHKSVTVRDNDTDGPAVSGMVVAEYDGDGDGIIGADEEVQIAWDLNDPSGIASTQLLVDGNPVTPVYGLPGGNPIDANCYAILGPLSAGQHTYEIRATDTDNSPDTSTWGGTFGLAAAEEITILLDASALIDGQPTAINFGSVFRGDAAVQRIFIVRNDGEQALNLRAISVPAGFTVSGPASSVLSPGSTTHFIVTLATGTPGTFAGEITLANSDGTRSPDGLDEDPFNFPITGYVGNLPGDANGDGVVDAIDYIALKTNFGAGPGASRLMGDLSGDGYVNWTDLQELMAQFGTRSVVGGAPATPEPATEPVQTGPSEPTEPTMVPAFPAKADVVTEPELLSAAVADAVAEPELLPASVADVVAEPELPPAPVADAPEADVLAIAASILGNRLVAGGQNVPVMVARPANSLPPVRAAVRVGPLSIASLSTSPLSPSPLLRLGRAGQVVADILQLAGPWWSGDSARGELPDEPWMTRLTVDISGKPRMGRLDPIGLDVLAVRR